MTSAELRLKNARALASQEGGIAAFARKLKCSDSQASQIIGKTPTRGIGHQLARDIEQAFGKEKGWLDLPHDDSEELTPAAIDVAKSWMRLPPKAQSLIAQLLGMGIANPSEGPKGVQQLPDHNEVAAHKGKIKRAKLRKE